MKKHGLRKENDFDFLEDDKEYEKEKQRIYKKENAGNFIEGMEEEENGLFIYLIFKKDFIEKNREESLNRNQRKTLGKSLAHQIFSKREQEEDKENIKQKRNRNDLIRNRNLLKREDLAEEFLRSDDMDIIKKDIPERIQLNMKDKDK